MEQEVLAQKSKVIFFGLSTIVLLSLLVGILLYTWVTVPSLPVSSPLALVSQVYGETDEYARVVRVIDGDTVELEDGRRVRYIGIDAPEKGGKTTTECFADETSRYNKQLVEGKVVRLERDVSSTDRYGRLLRYVYVDNTMVNYHMVVEGYAVARTFPPDTKYRDYLGDAQVSARATSRGLWRECLREWGE